MKKLIFMMILGFCLVSCGAEDVAAFADTNGLAGEIYRGAGFDASGIYAEEVDEDSAFAFGIAEEEFDRRVENAVCLRQSVDTKGRELYVFEAESASDALWLAGTLYGSYEFAPCDAAEKMTVACAGKYVMLFKSSSAEIDSAVESFRALSGGALRFRKDMNNHG
ncbi:MAG: hypothetical protein IKM00_06920 [Clostridia bacterium]|nr:hypothetical protein [Clostridia bacterium]